MPRIPPLGEPFSNLRYLLEPPYPVKKLIFGACFALLASIWCFMQTESFLSWVSYPTDAQIHEHMRLSRELQERVARNSKRKARPTPLDKVFFSQHEEEQVTQAYDRVVHDQAFAKVLFDKFQISLKDTHVVVVAAWQVDMRDYCDEVGIVCPAAWEELEEAKTEGDVGGTTIRDKPPSAIRTFDGVPRIFLMTKAFTSPPNSLQIAMAHELLHAMNIPAYRLTVKLPGIHDPVALTRWQTDLSYLAEYKWYTREAGLETWDQYVAAVATVSFLGFLAINLFALFRHHRWRRLNPQ